MKMRIADDGRTWLIATILQVYLMSWVLSYLEPNWFTEATVLLAMIVLVSSVIRVLWHLLEASLSADANGWVKEPEDE